MGDEELNAVKAVFDSKFLTEGVVTKKFEEEFAKSVGAKYAVAVPNCTIALELALRVLNIGPGDEVVMPDFTYPATAEAVMLVGADSILVDVDVKSRNVTLEAIKEAITPKIKAIMPVSWGGNPLDKEIYDFAKNAGIPLIEDAACSLGSELDGCKVGSLADLTCFSLHPRKVITTGEGGMITTDNLILYNKMHSFKHFGMEEGRFVTLGSNYKFSNILGAIGLEQLKKLEKIVTGRIEKAFSYNQLLKEKGYLTIPYVSEGNKHNFQSYTVLLKENGIRDSVISYLHSEGIESQIGTFALHTQPAFANLKNMGGLTNSSLLFNNLLSLPLHGELTLDDQKRVCGCLDDFFNKTD